MTVYFGAESGLGGFSRFGLRLRKIYKKNLSSGQVPFSFVFNGPLTHPHMQTKKQKCTQTCTLYFYHMYTNDPVPVCESRVFYI